jgi:hypothetical protein
LGKLEPKDGTAAMLPSWQADKGLLEWLTSL